MTDQTNIAEGPNFAEGVRIADLTSTVTKGRVGEEPAILVRTNGETYILGAFFSLSWPFGEDWSAKARSVLASCLFRPPYR